MFVYNYNNITKEYTGSGEAQIDELTSAITGSTQYLMPANSTTIAPPSINDNQIQCYIGGIWAICDDYRNEVYYYISGATEVEFAINDTPIFGTMTTEIPSSIFNHWLETKWVEARPSDNHKYDETTSGWITAPSNLHYWDGTKFNITLDDYAEYKILTTSRLVGTEITEQFSHTISGQLYNLSLKLENQTNYDAMKTKADAVSGTVQKLSMRLGSDNSRKFLYLDATEINSLYDAAYTHKKTILDAFNAFKEDAINASDKTEIDTLEDTYISGFIS